MGNEWWTKQYHKTQTVHCSAALPNRKNYGMKEVEVV